ncbi:MAG: tRNA (pseudouridine(54)-N(1))-methyltransferase TrmY [Candidatus Pacearchaeota archaeon]
MREILYYSKNARTSGNFDLTDLMKAGRMDIACQMTIMAFFVSHHIRPDVKLHMIFDGAPDPPKHLEMYPGENIKFGDIGGKIDISKKDVASLIKKMLYKYRKGEKTEIAKGYSIEKKSFLDLCNELKEQGKIIYIMDKGGEDIRDIKNEDLENAVFILGDQDGIDAKYAKRLKSIGIRKISVGKQMYFASQTLTIIQNELDRRGI